jgi:hypothetical protein
MFFEQTWGLTAAAAGLVAATFAFVNLFARPMGGLVSDRFGNRRIRVIFDTDNNTSIRNVSDMPGGAASVPAENRGITLATGIPARVSIYTTDIVPDVGDYHDSVGA